MNQTIFVIFSFVCIFTSSAYHVNKNNHEILEIVKQGFDEYLRTQIRPAYLYEALSNFRVPHIFRDQVKLGIDTYKKSLDLDNNILCGLCDTVASFIVGERKLGMTADGIKNEIKLLCEVLRVENKKVCTGAIDLNADIILYIIDNNKELKAGKFCDIMLQDFNCNYTNISWSIDVPEGISPDRPKPSYSPSTYRILHVTDVHMDPLYTPNKVKLCSDPLCCQSDQEDGTEGNSCGYWAEYGNDISENLVDEMIRFANTLDIDFVYFTGDIVSHRVWSTSQDSNTATIKTFLQKLRNGFKVPVFPTLGNHEPNPVNQFASKFSTPANLSTEWLFKLIEEEWSEWLPKSTINTIAKGGFYTVSPKEGLRLIVLNSNVAYRACWWLLENEKDPYGQLDWLISILSQAEAKNESVHILSHLPTGAVDLFKIWGQEYTKIVNRFSNTITGQFNGHVHFDTFQLYFNTSDPGQAVGVAWNGASLVSYEYENPSFKVYSVDKDTFDVIDIDQWTFNLTKANENPDRYPEWYKIYSFREAFNVPTLQPYDMEKLVVEMATNHDKLAQYHLYRYRNSSYAVDLPCDDICQKEYLCDFSTSFYGETSRCDYYKQLYDNNV